MPTTAAEVARLRIAIQSGNRLLRESIAARLEHEPSLNLIGTVAGDTDLLQLCELRRPDTIVLEPDSAHDPAPLIRTLRKRYERLRIIGLTGDADMALRLQRAGAHRVISPSGGLRTLLSTLRKDCFTHNPEEYIAGDVDIPADDSVTDDELRILHLIGSGYTLDQMASALGLTPSAVERHKRRIFGKLAAQSQAQAISRALRLGLISTNRENTWQSRRSPSGQQPPTALVHGEPGALVDKVAKLLTKDGVEVISDYSEHATDAEHPAWDHRGPLVVVLVDPDPEAWFSLPDPEARTVVVWSEDPGQRTLIEALLRGVESIVPADLIESAFLPSFHLAAQGFLVTDAERAHRFVRAGYARMAQSESPVPMDLTGRERDILTLIERGHTVRQTARALGISVKTVETLQSRLFRKLGVRSSSEAIVVAHGFGLLGSEEQLERAVS